MAAGGTIRPDWTDEEFQACLRELRTSGMVEVAGVKISAEQAIQLWVEARSRKVTKLFVWNCEFVGSADFSGIQMANGCTADFIETTFSGTANFVGTTFTGYADFSETTFQGNADFSHTVFDGKADFSRAVFFGDAVFNPVTFTDDAIFFRTTFTDLTIFEASFNGKADFVGTTFADFSDFSATTFHGSADFAETTFTGGTDFVGVQFTTNAEFHGARFARRVELSNVSKLQARNAHFEAGARILVRRDGELELRAAHFGGPSLVGVCQPQEDESAQTPLQPRIKDLSQANVELLTVSGVDLTGCLFENAHGLSGMGIEGATMFGRIERNGLRDRLLPTDRCVIAEEMAWRNQDDQDDCKNEFKKLANAASIESTYRALRVGLEKRHETGLASDFYYGEMEMRRRGTEPRAVRGLLVGYWALSGYGTRALRTFGWLLFMLIAFTLAYTSYRSLNFDQAALLSLESSVSLLRPPDTPALSDVGPYLVIFQRLFGTLLFGLFLLALRARVKR